MLTNKLMCGGDVSSGKLTSVTYTVSSTYTSNTAPTYAVMNDDTATGASNQWGSTNEIGPYIMADIGSTKTVNKVIIGYDYLNNLPGGWGPSYTQGKTISVSTNGATWTNVATTPTTTPANGLAEIIFSDVSARYVRMSDTSVSKAFLAATEFQVWGY